MNYTHSQKSETKSTLRKQEKGGSLQREEQGLVNLQQFANKSPQITQLMALKNQINKTHSPFQLKQDEGSVQKSLPIQLKSGVEELSGLNMSDVKVNYNSSEPSKLGAAAYAQGSDIHLGPGQEKHLPHEAWHVVQQKKENVPATQTINGTAVNENENLEKQADLMGQKAQDLGKNTSRILQRVSLYPTNRAVLQKNETDVETGKAVETVETPNPALLEKLAKYRGLIDMAKNAPDILADSGLWQSIVNKLDVMGTTETVGGLVGAMTKGVSDLTNNSDADKVAADVSSSVGASITGLFSMIKSIRTLYNGFKNKDKMAAAMGSRDFVNAVKSGLEAANSIIKFTSGLVNPAIAQAIPGLGIVISAADIMINLHNTWNASNAENIMTEVSEKHKGHLSRILGGEPEKKANTLFDMESRGKAFHKKDYLRLKPKMMAKLDEIAADSNPDAKFEDYKTKNNLPSTLTFNDFYMAVRTYELGSKLQEINQKRKTHGGNEIFTSILSIAGSIATFFPADGGVTAAVLKGSSLAIKSGLSAGKFLQQQSRNKGRFGADTTRSSSAKHQEYVQHAKSIYMILAQSGMKGQDEMSLETSKIDQLVPVEHMINAAGASPKAVYNTNYSDKGSVFDQIKLIVDSMKKGRG